MLYIKEIDIGVVHEEKEHPLQKAAKLTAGFLMALLDFLTPLGIQVKLIEAKHNKSMQDFFNFLRQQLSIAIIQTLIFLPMYYSNFVA